jgi:undecaprenyl-diphosphatase
MSRPVAERGTLPPRGTSIAMLVVFATLGTLLGVVAAGDNVLAFDVTVLEAVQKVDVPGLVTVVRVSNDVFDTVGALALAALLIVVALALGRRAFVLQVAIVMVLRLAGQGLKPIFDSPRPGTVYQPDPSLVSTTMGYPSGHAYTATVLAAMLVLFVHSLDAPRWARVTSIVAAVALTAVAIFSRVYVGAHWPTDTVGGVCYGLATVALMQLIVAAILGRARLPLPSRTERAA